jgi:sugar lactone lactonase YvrE
MHEEVQCAVPAGDICGEGAVWHPEQKALYWTDINRFVVHRFDPSTGAANAWIFHEPVTAVNLTTDSDLLLLVMGSRVVLWSPRTHPEVETIYRLATAPEMRLNDARIDPRGSLWAGTMRNNVGPQGENIELNYAGGVLYRIDPDGAVSEWKTGVGISNTLAWSADGKRFYFGDSMANTIYWFDYDVSNGAITGERLHIAGYPQGLPDGSAIDAQGYLWNARYGGRCLIRIDPNGQVDRVVALPTLNPTTCAFGGSDLRTLYITSARSQDRLSGSVFSMRVEVGGLPEHPFQLL